MPRISNFPEELEHPLTWVLAIFNIIGLSLRLASWDTPPPFLGASYPSKHVTLKQIDCTLNQYQIISLPVAAAAMKRRRSCHDVHILFCLIL